MYWDIFVWSVLLHYASVVIKICYKAFSRLQKCNNPSQVDFCLNAKFDKSTMHTVFSIPGERRLLFCSVS